MGKMYLDRTSFGQSNVGEREREQIMHTVFAISLARAYHLIPFHVFQFSDLPIFKLEKLVMNYGLT